MNDIVLLWDYIKKHPNEDTSKRALADKYEEDQQHTMAYALRWCVKYRRWPNMKYYHHNKRTFYYFVQNRNALDFKSQGNSIPHYLFDRWDMQKESLEEVILQLGKKLELRKKELEA